MRQETLREGDIIFRKAVQGENGRWPLRFLLSVVDLGLSTLKISPSDTVVHFRDKEDDLGEKTGYGVCVRANKPMIVMYPDNFRL